MRAALYARYSPDQQNQASIADQFRACRRHAERQGFEVVADYSDQAISGASIANRPGLRQLIEDARKGRFQVVVAEALDRLTRSGGDAWDIFEDLRAAGVAIHTISEGQVEELAVGLKGTMNALFLRELSAKTRRGQEGVARSGRHNGGKTYGYDIRREFDAKGEVIRGLRTINEREADIVRRSFPGICARILPTRYRQPPQPRRRLRARGGQWNASTINGNAKRGNGLLHNEMYRGVIVWGRHSWVKDRRTARRMQRDVDPAQVVRIDQPDFRIVDDELWQAAQRRFAQVQRIVSERGPPAARRPQALLSGLLRCVCGGPMTIGGPDRRYLCSIRRERGPSVCGMTRSARTSDVEAKVFVALQDQLLEPDMLEAAIEAYFGELVRTAEARAKRRLELERELAELTRRACGW